MWIFLYDSFLSVVQANDDPDFLMVRARLRGDIERVFPEAVVSEDRARDYRFRAKLPRVIVVASIEAEITASITYDNFKNSVKNARRHSAYLAVWKTMLHEQLFEERAEAERKPIPPAPKKKKAKKTNA